jgi:hypothetical protein
MEISNTPEHGPASTTCGVRSDNNNNNNRNNNSNTTTRSILS